MGRSQSGKEKHITMSNAKITIKLESHLDDAKIDFKRALKQWGNAVGGEMVNLTHRPKSNGGTPVDTGRLRNSMAYATSADNKTIYVGSNVEYAKPVEEGARGHKPARMCRNAVRDVKDFAEDFLQFVLDNNKTI